MPKVGLSIVVSALNEAGKIAEIVGGILPLARMFLEDFEIILVDDGSTDDTGAIMDRFALRDPRVRVIHNSYAMGEAFAFKTGLVAPDLDDAGRSSRAPAALAQTITRPDA